MIQSIEPQSISDNSFIFKSQLVQSTEEHKYIYILGPLDKTKIKCIDGTTEEEVNKILVNEEKNILYGNLYISTKTVDKLLQLALDIRKCIDASNKKSPAARDRDFKIYKVDFQQLIE